MPSSGKTSRARWMERSLSAADMVAAGAFDLAQEALHRQFGIVNFEPMKAHFVRIFASCHGVVSAMPNSKDIAVGIRRDGRPKADYMASTAVTMARCQEMMASAFEKVTAAEFESAIGDFRTVLHSVPLLVISSSEQLKDARNVVAQCSQYINALRVKLAANECPEGGQRQFELNCFFTHFELQDAHIFSGLYGAMKSGYKSKHYRTTAVLCRRLLELAVSGRVKKDASQKYIVQVKKVLKKCEQKGPTADTAAEDKLEYKAHDFTALCCQSLRPIARNEETVKSPYCGSLFKAEFNGMLSPVCNLVRIGGNNQGLTINTK